MPSRKRSVIRSHSGQAAAEFAAVLPIFILFMMLLVEIGVVLLDQLAVERVAREAARTAAVTASPAEIQAAARAASGLPEDRLFVDVGQRPDVNGMVRVTVHFHAEVVEPFTGMVLFRPQLEAMAAMRVEGMSGI